MIARPETMAAHVARATAPCKVHGRVAREMETGWTHGIVYACPRCRDTEAACDLLTVMMFDAMKDSPACPQVIALLGSAMRHLDRDRRVAYDSNL